MGHGLGNDRRAAKPQPAPRDEAPCRDPSQRPVLGHDRPVRRRTVRPGRRDDTGRRQTDGAGGDSAHGLAGGKRDFTAVVPAFDDLIEEAKPLVRLQGIYKEAQV